MPYDLKLMDHINRTPLLGDRSGANIAGWYSCIRHDHLHGFEPILCFGKMTTISEYPSGESTPSWERKHPLGPQYYETWLLLEKNGRLFVDHMRGIDKRGFYGVLPNPPKISEILLPSDVYDAFRGHVGLERWHSLIMED